MPRKIGYKWERVVDLDNCRAAVREMLKSKKRRSLYAGLNTASRKRLTCIIRKRAQRREWNGTVRYFRDHVEEIALQIHEELRSGTWKPKPYREKLIYDALRRKWRRLKVPCLYDQAVHHAIMRQTIPDIMARKYYYDCGSVRKLARAGP